MFEEIYALMISLMGEIPLPLLEGLILLYEYRNGGQVHCICIEVHEQCGSTIFECALIHSNMSIRELSFALFESISTWIGR